MPCITEQTEVWELGSFWMKLRCTPTSSGHSETRPELASSNVLLSCLPQSTYSWSIRFLALSGSLQSCCSHSPSLCGCAYMSTVLCQVYSAFVPLGGDKAHHLKGRQGVLLTFITVGCCFLLNLELL